MSAKAKPTDNFTTVISLHKGSNGEQAAREYLAKNEFHGKVIFVSDEDN